MMPSDLIRWNVDSTTALSAVVACFARLTRDSMNARSEPFAPRGRPTVRRGRSDVGERSEELAIFLLDGAWVDDDVGHRLDGRPLDRLEVVGRAVGVRLLLARFDIRTWSGERAVDGVGNVAHDVRD